MNTDTLYDNLVEYGVATEDEIRLVTCINGYSVESLESILYARTANRSWDQFEDELE